MLEVKKDILKSVYQPRPQDSKKYDHGFLLVVGGSQFYSGSPALSALAALKAGCDMVEVIAVKRAADIIASFSPVLAAYPLVGEWLGKEHLPTLFSMAESARVRANGKAALVIGGGVGRSETVQTVVREFLSETTLPTVVDADALHALAKEPKLAEGKRFLLTPHTYEFYILTGKDVHKLPDEEKIKIVQEEAGRLKTTILLKGRNDIISDGQEVAVNRTGSPYLAKGGTGDTLAGIAGAFLARGLDAFVSAQAAAYINGLAGETAAEKLKESLLATDLIEAIPSVIG
jgi:NAD(P)H-hydrate epimerase